MPFWSRSSPASVAELMRQCTAPPAALTGRWPPAGAAVVGGAVRDAHRGVVANDVDWLLGAPEEAAHGLAAAGGGTAVALDPARGHWRVVWPDGSGVVRTWDLARPDPPGDPRDRDVLVADLWRRDLTVNAMAYLPATLEVVDPTGGRADLNRRLARAVRRGALWHDPLRGWRVVRLAAQLGLRIERHTRTWVGALAADLAAGRAERPAPERVGAELEAILASAVAGRAFAALAELGLLALDLPELTAGRGVAQGPLHHLDVLDHQLEALQRLVDAFPDADPALRWATLLHDVGKPPTRTPGTVTGDGLVLRDRFHGHDRLGAEMSAAALRRLRRPNATIARVRDLVAAHMRSLPDDERGARRFVHRLRPLLPDLLRLMLADREAARGRAASTTARRRYRERAGRVLAVLAEPPPAAPPLTGREVMAELGLPPGPLVGAALAAASEAQAVGDVTTSEEAVAYLRRWLAARRRDEHEP